MQVKQKVFAIAIFCALLLSGMEVPRAFASAPNAGGDTTVVNPVGESAVSITEDAVQPEQANIRLIVPTLTDPAGGTPSSIRIVSVTGGTLWQGGGSTFTLGSSGTVLSLTAGKLDLRFRPDAGRDTNASFQYVVVDPHNSVVNSAASTATIPITAVNDAPVLQTSTGSTGIGLAATYYLNAWDLTGSTSRRIDATVNFANNFGVTGLNVENFSVRWTGKVQSPVTGNVTFSTISDDGVRLWVDGNLIIDNWTLHGDTLDTAAPVALVAGQQYDIRMEFYERGGGEVAKLYWAYTGQSSQIIPQTYLYPATTRPAMTYVNGSPAAIIDDAVAVSDVDSANMTGATVVISANYQAAQDFLQFANQNGISGSFSTGTLTLTGTATAAQYQTALRSVKYYNSNPSPVTSTRTIEFTVHDGVAASNPTSRDIVFSGVNNPPVITEGASASVTMDEDATPTAFALTLNATDADYHSITWSISSQASHGTASASGTGDSKAISYTPTANYYGSDSFVVQASDGAGGTDTITVAVTIRDKTAPVISNLAVSGITNTTGIVSWTTDENASTQVYSGTSAGTLPLLSLLLDTSPRVTSHTYTMTGLLPCTRYFWTATSVDGNANTTTSTEQAFTTTGCAAGTVPTAQQAVFIDTSTPGTVSTSSGTAGITVNTPASFHADPSVVIQVKAIDGSQVLAETGRPTTLPRAVGSIVFDVKAIINSQTVVDTFDAPVTITYTYADADTVGLDEASLWLYHYHNGAWEALDSCNVNRDSNTISCTTESFSVFGIFGRALGGGGFGYNVPFKCTDPKALNYYSQLANHDQSQCQYAAMAVPGESSSTEVLAQPVVRFTQDLKTGQEHREVQLLQQMLNACGFVVAVSGPGSAGSETSKFGAATRQAVMRYQKAQGIVPANGVVGPQTRARLNVAECAVSATPSAAVRDLFVGMTGEDVRQLQTILIQRAAGPKAAELRRVTATGYFSNYTYNALREYQSINSVSPANGYFGSQTRSRMEVLQVPGRWW